MSGGILAHNLNNKNRLGSNSQISRCLLCELGVLGGQALKRNRKESTTKPNRPNRTGSFLTNNYFRSRASANTQVHAIMWHVSVVITFVRSSVAARGHRQAATATNYHRQFIVVILCFPGCPFSGLFEVLYYVHLFMCIEHHICISTRAKGQGGAKAKKPCSHLSAPRHRAARDRPDGITEVADRVLAALACGHLTFCQPGHILGWGGGYC